MPKKPNAPRPWLCKNGHLLGHVIKEGDEYVLYVYRHAINPHAPVKGQRPEVVCTIVGAAQFVACSVPGCGARKPWDEGKDRLDRLIRRVKGRGKNVGVTPLTVTAEAA